MKTTNKILWFSALCATAQCASATILFQDNFDSFSLGTIWQPGPESIAPDQTLQVINDGGKNVLDMASSYGGAIRRPGIATITPISTAGFTSITADVLFKSLSGTNVSMEFVLIGNLGGDRWYIQPFQNYHLAWDHSPNVIYTPTSPGVYYDISLTMDFQGTHVALMDTSNNVLATADYAPNTLSTLGTSFTIALAQATGGTTPEAYVDHVTVVGTPEPSTLAMLALSAASFLNIRRRRSAAGI